MKTYKSAVAYFRENETRIASRFSDRIAEFELIYDETIALVGGHSKSLSPESGTSMALLLRALKYAFASFQLALQGHITESMILQRNATELRVVALDFVVSPEPFGFWQVIQKEKAQLRETTSGVIDSKALRAALVRRLGNRVAGTTFKASLSRLRKSKFAKEHQVALCKLHDDLSEYWSHENLFNIARRTDVVRNHDGTESTEVYTGYDSSSNLAPYLRAGISVAGGIREDVKNILALHEQASSDSSENLK